jgi:hypothetical protein
VIRSLSCLVLFVGAVASGQGRPIAPTDCDDNFAECKEDCAIKWGGTTNLKMRGKLGPCVNKCSSVELDCRETFFETRRSQLDEGSISGSPSSRDSDSDGLPTKTAQKKKDDEPAPKVEKKKEVEAKPAYELKAEEVPKSNRTQLSKVDEPGDKPAKVEAPKKAAVAEPEPAPAAPPPSKKTEKREEPKKDEKKKALDEWDPDSL